MLKQAISGIKWTCIAIIFIAIKAHALTASEVMAISVGESDARVEALSKSLAQADEKTHAFIQALSDDAVKLADGKVFIIKDSKAFDPVTGTELPLSNILEDIVNNNRMRGELDAALAGLKLFSKDESARSAAIKTLQSDTDISKLPLIQKAIAAETAPILKSQLELLRAAILLNSNNKAERIEAAKLLSSSTSITAKTALLDRLKSETETDVQTALNNSLREVESSLAWGDKLGAMFSGISLGSILLLVALGLAITYGLMGVINMAHGELMMIGAYATYVVQILFQNTYLLVLTGICWLQFRLHF